MYLFRLFCCKTKEQRLTLTSTFQAALISPWWWGCRPSHSLPLTEIFQTTRERTWLHDLLISKMYQNLNVFYWASENVISKCTKTFTDKDNWQTGGLGNTSVGKDHTLLDKHQVPSLDPQHSHKKPGAAVSWLQCWKSGACWQASLAKLMSFRFSEWPYKKYSGE